MRQKPIPIVACLAISGIAVLTACTSSPGSSNSSSSGSVTTVTIGNVPTTGPYTPVCVANKMGFFKAQGLKVSYVEAVTPAQDKALLGGSLDFGTLDSYEVLAANAAGGHLVMIASMSNVPASSLYVQKSVSSVQELKGKTVAVGSTGTASYIAAQILFSKYGMTGDVKLQPIAGGGPPVLAALTRNLVSGAQFSPPNTAVAAEKGYKDLVNGPDLGVQWVQGGVVTTQAFATAHPATVKNVAAGVAAAWTYMANPAHKANTISLISKCTGTSAADAAATYDYMIKIWRSQKTPTVSEAAMQAAIRWTPVAEQKGLKVTGQFDNSYLPSGS